MVNLTFDTVVNVANLGGKLAYVKELIHCIRALEVDNEIELSVYSWCKDELRKIYRERHKTRAVNKKEELKKFRRVEIKNIIRDLREAVAMDNIEFAAELKGCIKELFCVRNDFSLLEI